MHIIFYGPEGSGKGTQAKKLGERLGIPVLTSGDLVRKAASEDKGEIGDACRNALTKGAYVPDSYMYELWKRILEDSSMKNGWIMDGFPRNEEQARFLDDTLQSQGKAVNAVIYLVISEEESMKRLLKRARPLHPGSKELHDSPERIRARLETYKAAEAPLLSYYKHKGVLLEINGEQAPVGVEKEIAVALPK